MAALLAAFTFLVTCSIMVALPIWEPTLGFPALGPLGQFLIKDIALLGISLVVLGECLGRRSATADRLRLEPASVACPRATRLAVE